MSVFPVIVITGASSGIGAATARKFAQEGYRVVLAARRYERLEDLAEEISKIGGEALPVETNVSQLEDIHNLVQKSLEAFGQIDILFNNAGFARLEWLEDLNEREEIQAQFEVNVLGLIWLTRAVLPHMIDRQEGHIINMASTAGLVAMPQYSVYAATKFAVQGFSQALRREVKVHNIHVSTICPGGVETEFGAIAGFGTSTKIVTPKPLMLSAENVAEAVWGIARRPRRCLVIPWVLSFSAWMNTLLPGAMDWIANRLYVEPERG